MQMIASLAKFGLHDLNSIAVSKNIFSSAIPLYSSTKYIEPLTKKTFTLMNTLKKSDLATYTHSVGLATHAFNFSHFLELSSEETNILYLASLLHDFGKIFFVNLHSLPNRLTPEEHNSLAKHTAIGYIVLKNHGYADFVALASLYHHSIYNHGIKYPQAMNISEDELIALHNELRINQKRPFCHYKSYYPSETDKCLLSVIMLMDSFDAMLDVKRTYKKAIPLSGVMEELEDFWGYRYNPSLKKPLAKYIKWLSSKI